MTEDNIYAIEQVIIMNRDICTLLEQRGVSREDVREICKLAAWMNSEIKKENLKFYLPRGN
jgi:hypothetical protein